MSLAGTPIKSHASDVGEIPPSIESFVSLGIYVGMAVLLILLLLFLAWWLGNKTHGRVKEEPYECGVLPTGEARLSEPVPFYLVAIFFIIFDVEMIFVVSWAVAYDLLGLAGFLNVSFFILILFVGLVHLWPRLIILRFVSVNLPFHRFLDFFAPINFSFGFI